MEQQRGLVQHVPWKFKSLEELKDMDAWGKAWGAIQKHVGGSEPAEAAYKSLKALGFTVLPVAQHVPDWNKVLEGNDATGRSEEYPDEGEDTCGVVSI